MTQIIIDTDIGTDIDDTWALAMALGCHELDIRLITTCTGDTRFRAALVCKFLETVGRSDIDVGIGRSSATGPSQQTGWLDGYDIADYPGSVHEDAVEAMISVIRESADPVTLVAIGPLPNVSALIQRAPDLIDKIRFVGMHGSIYRGYLGAPEPHAEYNVKQHLEDAKTVFGSAVDMTITPLDTCGTVRLRGDRYARLRESSNRAVPVTLENYRSWLKEIDKDVDIADDRSSTLYDTVAIYLAFAEDLLEIDELPLIVDDDGMTVVATDGKRIRAATNWRDEEAFLDLLIERLLAAP
ncbi:MAG: nucleoside hydrolase [Pseudomonadales bacterium]|nr:nucleoside hydrolase [Pseudomonadales bacterium]